MDKSILIKKILSIHIIILLISFGFVDINLIGSAINKEYVETKNIIVDYNGKGNYTNIQEAIDNASSGDTIYIWAGTYNEKIIINKSITLIGNGTENTFINWNQKGDVIFITSDNVNITGFSIIHENIYEEPNYGSGIEIEHVKNITILNNICKNNWKGIKLSNSNSVNITNNYCDFNKIGISILGSNNNSIQNNICNRNDFGIGLINSNNNKIFNNICNENNKKGMELSTSNFNKIINNTCNSNNLNGIKLNYCEKNTISNNTCKSNGEWDIYLDVYCENNKLNNNTGKLYIGKSNYRIFEIITYFCIGIAFIIGVIILYFFINRMKKNKSNIEKS